MRAWLRTALTTLRIFNYELEVDQVWHDESGRFIGAATESATERIFINPHFMRSVAGLTLHAIVHHEAVHLKTNSEFLKNQNSDRGNWIT